MGKYSEYLQQARANISEKKSQSNTKASMYSKTALVSLTAELLNNPDETITLYSGGKDGVVENEVNPAKAHREQLKKVAKQTFGIDDADAAKLDSVKFSKGYAESIVDIGLVATKDYLDIGKKLTLPMRSTKETQATIAVVGRDQKETKLRELKDGPDGKKISVETDKVSVTAPQNVVKVSNKTMAWNKETK